MPTHELRQFIRDIPNYPKEGILFYDITPLLGDGPSFGRAIDALADKLAGHEANKIVCAEARGFIFGAALAYKLGIGLVPVRKPGKLPHKIKSVTYDLEYGTDTLCMHEDALVEGDRVIVIDDVLATGGTLKGVLSLIEGSGADVAAIAVLLELKFLQGQSQLEGYACYSVLDL